MFKYLIPLFILPLIVSCENEPSKHEILFNQTADSLIKYRADKLPGFEGNQKAVATMHDYTTLDYASFCDKYQMSDKQMDGLAQSYKVSYELVKAFKSIEDNIQMMNENHYERGDTVKAEYSFQKALKQSEELKKEGPGGDIEIEVLEGAQDVKKSQK